MRSAMLVPSCASFTATALPCSACRSEMRLVRAEPHPEKPGLEFRTYCCVPCESEESYLIHL